MNYSVLYFELLKSLTDEIEALEGFVRRLKEIEKKDEERFSDVCDGFLKKHFSDEEP